MQAAPFNIPCKNGSLRIQDGYLRIHSYGGKILWQVPVNTVTGISEVSRKIMVVIEVHSTQGNRQVEWIAPDKLPLLQQALATSQASAPILAYQNFYNDATQPSFSAPAPPRVQAGQQRVKFRQWWSARRKRTKWGIGCGSAVALLLLCSLCSFAVNAGASQQASTTPTAISANIVVGNSASPTSALPTAIPTAKPTPKPTPKPVPTHAPQPTATPRPTGVNGNPWGYDFNPGNLIYNPPATFCDYFACIASFWNGRGYVNECQDSTYSKSGGIQGDCSHHGGELQPLYSH